MNRKNKSKKQIGPRTAEEFFSKSEAFQDRWERMTHVVTRMRAGVSLHKASREEGISPSAVLRLAGSALRKRRNGRYAAKPSDRLLRVIEVLTPEGTYGRLQIGIRGSRQATEIAEHWNTVNRYLQTGDRSGLKKFDGEFIMNTNGQVIQFLTDPSRLMELASAGVLSFETLYARTA
jgi:hypothetical protein